MITDAFDNTTEEIIRPSHRTDIIEGFPEIVLVAFSERLLNILLSGGKTEAISSMHAGTDIPVYKTEYRGKTAAFYLTWVGGPATVGLLEEIIAKGGRKILLFGACGSLDHTITDGHIIVPTAAYRDEGTSYHYAPASDFIEVRTAERLLKIFSELEIPAIGGKTWTTDAFYRETRKNMELRKKAGCIAVEMECASVMALADFRGVDIYQFLYTADNLDCAEWESRLLWNMPDDLNEKIVRIALEVAVRM